MLILFGIGSCCLPLSRAVYVCPAG